MSKTEAIKTINTLSLVCLIFYFIFKLQWLLITALVLLLTTLIAEKAAFFIAKYWLKFATLIGNFNSKIILSVVFYLILTPVALAYRLFNKEPVNYFKNKQQNTYYKDINLIYNKEFFQKLW